MRVNAWQVAAGLAILFIFGLSATIAYRFMDVILLAIVVAFFISPITEKLHYYGKKAPTWLTWLTGNHSVAALVAFIIFILPFVFTLLQVANLISNPQGTQVLLDILYFSPELSDKVTSILNFVGLEAFSGTISEEIRVLSGNLLSQSADAMNTLAQKMMIDIPLFLIITFYLIDDGPALFYKIKSYIPQKQRFMYNLFNQTSNIAYGLFMGFFLTSIITGVIATTGFWIMSLLGILPLKTYAYAVFMGLAVALFSLLPIVGAWTVFLPAAGWVLMTQPANVAVFNAITIIVFGLIFLIAIPDFYIRPKIAGRESHVHPLILIIGFLGGTLLWGMKGIILGPLSLGLTQAVITSFLEYENSKQQAKRKSPP